MKCGEGLSICSDNCSTLTVRCDLDKGHSGSHVFYGDNYKIVFLTKDRAIENLFGKICLVNDNTKEMCKRKLLVENLAEDLF